MKFLINFFFLFFTFTLSANEITAISIAAGDDFRERVKLGIENKESYCKKYGYKFVCADKTLDTSRHPAWSKILLALETFNDPECKWVVWLDADTLIMNKGIPLSDFIDPNYNLIISQDWNGINSGVFFIKNCEWSKQLLKQAYNHTEFLNHHWYEQLALIREINKPEFTPLVKVVPQRFFNAYPIESAASLNSTFQPGDFLIHFAGQHGSALSPLFSHYFKFIQEDGGMVSLDQYLGYYGFQLSPLHSSQNEGYMTQKQKEQFQEFLEKNQHIESILEIGLNGGHSADNFFQNCKKLKKFTSVDICMHPYAQAAVDYMTRKYKDRFEFIKGDSMKKIPEYTDLFSNQKFDLIYIDGNHSHEACTADIANCQKLAHANTILLIDDYTAWIQEIVDSFQAKGMIEIKNIHRSWDDNGYRAWAEARYLFPNNT